MKPFLCLSLTMLAVGSIPRTALAQWENLVAAPELLKTTAELIGLLESIESKVDRLMDVEFKTGHDLLDQANRAEDLEEKKALYREARIAFSKAASTAKDSQDGIHLLRRGLSRLGIWHCCNALGDNKNSEKALEQILEISTEPSFWVRREATFRQYPGSILAAYWPQLFWLDAFAEDEKTALINADPDRFQVVKLQATVIGLMVGPTLGDALPKLDSDSQALLLQRLMVIASEDLKGKREAESYIRKVRRIESRDGSLRVEAEVEYIKNKIAVRRIWEFNISSDFQKVENSRELTNP
jgi:hypothetical protein